MLKCRPWPRHAPFADQRGKGISLGKAAQSHETRPPQYGKILTNVIPTTGCASIHRVNALSLRRCMNLTRWDSPVVQATPNANKINRPIPNHSNVWAMKVQLTTHAVVGVLEQYNPIPCRWLPCVRICSAIPGKRCCQDGERVTERERHRNVQDS